MDFRYHLECHLDSRYDVYIYIHMYIYIYMYIDSRFEKDSSSRYDIDITLIIHLIRRV